MDIATVGVLGLGTIGRPIAQRMIAAGYRVTAFDPLATAVSRVKPLDVEIAATL